MSAKASDNRIAKILMPTDGSPLSLKAEALAVAAAKAFGAELVFVHVMPTALYLMPRSEQNIALEITKWKSCPDPDALVAKVYLQNAILNAQRSGLTAKAKLYRTTSSIREAICKIAKDLSADLIVLGTRGTSARRVIMGSVTAGVVTYADCPVLVVR